MAYHHGDLPAALVRAARELLAETSAGMISIREVARRVGVSANAPYRHFADRDAVIRAVVASGYRSAAGRLAGGRGVSDVAEVWQGLAHEEPALVGLMTRGLADFADDSELQASIGEWLGEVARAVEREVPDDDPAAGLGRAIGCWAAVHGMVALRDGGALTAIDDWLQPTPAELAHAVTARRRSGRKR